MSHKNSQLQSSVAALRIVSEAPVDEDAAEMITMLLEHLTLACKGKLRSLAIVSVSQDEGAIETHWTCSDGDSASLIGKLTVLAHDLMASRE